MTWRTLARVAGIPVALLVAVVAARLSVERWVADEGTRDALHLVGRVLLILLVAWLVIGVATVLEDHAVRRFAIDVRDNRAARRARTQVLMVRRVTVFVVVVLALGAVLLSLPGAETLGTGLLASAGVVGVVAAVAAQATLGNVIAGLQIVFSDSLRLDDAVVVEDEWGHVESISLTYVVVHLWDDRRLVLPTTYFTTTPFENWTRRTSELLGVVDLDVDWRVSPSGIRREMDRILAATDLWDGRVNVVQVIDATGGLLRIRVHLTAVDAPTLYDLRCHVREQLVDWLQADDEGGLPRQRVEFVERTAPKKYRKHTGSDGLFTGDDEAEQRALRATGQLPALDEQGQPRASETMS